MTSAPQTLSSASAAAARTLAGVRDQVHRVIVGQDVLIDRLLVGFLCGGHVLVEGVPGLAKTLTVSTLASAMRPRLRTHPVHPGPAAGRPDRHGDLQPGDGRFSVRSGPLFANLVLADEVNRAPAKVQSALLEAMQERQISIGGETFPLPQPFLVMATQNPIEQEGTYPLPEAQLDRFLLKVRVDYPSRAEERRYLEMGLNGRAPEARAVATAATSSRPAGRPRSQPRRSAEGLHRPGGVCDATAGGLPDAGAAVADRYGASPRASIALAQAARAHAFLRAGLHDAG